MCVDRQLQCHYKVGFITVLYARMLRLSSVARVVRTRELHHYHHYDEKLSIVDSILYSLRLQTTWLARVT